MNPSLSVVTLAEGGVEMQQLRNCLQEAHYREAVLNNKLKELSSVIGETQVATPMYGLIICS